MRKVLLLFIAVTLAIWCQATPTWFNLNYTTPAAGGIVTFDAVATSQVTGTGASGETSLTWSHTIGSGLTDSCLIVTCNVGALAANTIVSATYNGASMTLVGSVQGVASGGTGNGHLAVFRFLSPPSGAHNVVVNITSDLRATSDDICGVSTSWSGVDQTTPIDNISQTGNSGTNPSVTVTSAVNSRIIACASAGSAFSAEAATTRSTATQHNYNTGTGGGCFASSERAGAASATMTYTCTSDSWANIGFNLRHD